MYSQLPCPSHFLVHPPWPQSPFYASLYSKTFLETWDLVSRICLYHFVINPSNLTFSTTPPMKEWWSLFCYIQLPVFKSHVIWAISGSRCSWSLHYLDTLDSRTPHSPGFSTSLPWLLLGLFCWFLLISLIFNVDLVFCLYPFSVHTHFINILFSLIALNIIHKLRNPNTFSVYTSFLNSRL